MAAIKGDQKCLKKSNLLIYQKPVGEKTARQPCVSEKKFKPPLCNVKPKQIRVCTAKQMKKICPPKTCVCPPSRSWGFLKFLALALKAAVATGVVYVSYDLGVWGTVDDTQELYRKFCEAKTEAVKKNDSLYHPPSCEAERELFVVTPHNPYEHCRKPPFDLDKDTYRWRMLWNKGVQCAFSAMAKFPENLIKYIEDQRKAYNENSTAIEGKKKKCSFDNNEEIKIENVYGR